MCCLITIGQGRYYSSTLTRAVEQPGHDLEVRNELIQLATPKGLGSGIRIIQFFINRAGKNLPAARKRELEKAKKFLQEKAAKEK